MSDHPCPGPDDRTKALVHFLVQQCPVPMVIDADGLNNLAGHRKILKNRKADIILTPHPGEMTRLTGTTPKDVQKNRVDCARKFAAEFNVHVILKGARTLIAHPDGHTYISLTGNPGMASGGMGDVLTGMVAGFISQGYPPQTAAHLAVFLHGRAADNLSLSKGPYGYIASDVMDTIPAVISDLAGQMPYQAPHIFHPPVTELL